MTAPIARPRRPLRLLGSLLLAACSGDGGGAGPLPDLPECPGKVTVSVAFDPAPVFAWTPRCRLFLLLVEPAASGEDLWSVLSAGGNRIGPDVRYGTVPPGAEEFDPPAPLTRGASYKVVVARWTGPGEDDGETIGLVTFTP